MKHIQQSFSLRHVLIVVILVCATLPKQIHGCDNMIYEFNNGTVVSKPDTTPNGTNIARVYFKEYTDCEKLYGEIKEWANKIGCETTILLKRDSKPYVVVSPRLGAVE